MIHLVYATDNGYLIPTLVSALSAVHHCSDRAQLTVHLLDCGIEPAKWAKWKDDFLSHAQGFANLVRHEIDMGDFDGLRLWRGGKGAYGRLKIPKMLPDADWCLYCDGDTLFTDDPLKIVEWFDPNYAIVGNVDGTWYQQGWYDRNGLELKRWEYVCSGVLAMNLKMFREHDYGEKSLDFLRQHPDAPYVDQDALNVICTGHIKQVTDITWGVMSERVTNDGVNPKCIHYASRLPPRMNYIGMVDVVRLWFDYAERLAGLTVADCGFGATRGKFFRKRAIAKLINAALPLVGWHPRFAALKGQVLTKETWKQLGGSV